MFKSLKSRRSASASSARDNKSRARRKHSQSGPPVFEPLPARVMMSASPHPTLVIGHRESSPLTVQQVATGSTSPPGLTAAQVRHAFGVDLIKFGTVAGNGAGQTIAIVDAYHDPHALADLKTFDVAMGLPDPPVF